MKSFSEGGKTGKFCAESLGDGFRIVADELLDELLSNQLFASVHKKRNES